MKVDNVPGTRVTSHMMVCQVMTKPTVPSDCSDLTARVLNISFHYSKRILT